MRKPGGPASRYRPRLGDLFVDVFNGIPYGFDFFRYIVRNFDFEFFFKRHDQFHDVERIRTQIVDERRINIDVGFIDTQLIDYDCFYFIKCIHPFHHLSYFVYYITSPRSFQ